MRDETKSIWMDLLHAEDPQPRPGDFIQCIGRDDKLNTRYMVIESRQVQRREPTSRRRIAMKVINVAAGTTGTGSTFELRWYPRRKRKTGRTW